jgi:hypothetical protein
MSQTTNTDIDQVPIFCLADGVASIKPLLIDYAKDKLPEPTSRPAAPESALPTPTAPPGPSAPGPSVPGPSAPEQPVVIGVPDGPESERQPGQGSMTQVDKDAAIARSVALGMQGGAAPDCSQQTGNIAHVAATIDNTKENGLANMVKTVVLLPGFFQGNISYPNVGKEINSDTISISSIIGLVLLSEKSGETRQLPLYRHTFVSTVPLGNRSQNHVFSLFPLLKTDEFLSSSKTIEECFGLRPQNSQQYMYSKAHVRGVITETFPDKDFPWLGFNNKTQKLNTDNPTALADLITQSDKHFATLRTATRDMKMTGACALADQAKETSELSAVYRKLDNKALLPSWMKSAGAKAPPMLAEGWGTPSKPDLATVESFMCKLHLQGFLFKQQALTRELIGGSNYLDLNLAVSAGDSDNTQYIATIDSAIKDYLAAYRNALGSDVTLTPATSVKKQIGGDNPPNTLKLHKGFIGNTQVQTKLGDQAVKWLDAIHEKMVTYNSMQPGNIIDRQYTLEDIRMKTQVLALILAAVTGMAPTVIPRVSSDNVPGDPNLVPKKEGGSRTKCRTCKKRAKRKAKTYKSK